MGPEWNVDGLGEDPHYKAAQLKGASLLHWSGPRKAWLPGGLYRGKWLPYYLHWTAPRHRLQPPSLPKERSTPQPIRYVPMWERLLGSIISTFRRGHQS